MNSHHIDSASSYARKIFRSTQSYPNPDLMRTTYICLFTVYALKIFMSSLILVFPNIYYIETGLYLSWALMIFTLRNC